MSETARNNDFLQELVAYTFDHPQVTGTTSWKVFKAVRKCRVVKVEYINPTGLAADATNQFAISAKNGSTVVADGISNASPAAIAADTFAALTLSATAANRILAADDVLSLVATETAAATLPAGRVVVHVKYL